MKNLLLVLASIFVSQSALAICGFVPVSDQEMRLVYKYAVVQTEAQGLYASGDLDGFVVRNHVIRVDHCDREGTFINVILGNAFETFLVNERKVLDGLYYNYKTRRDDPLYFDTNNHCVNNRSLRRTLLGIYKRVCTTNAPY